MVVGNVSPRGREIDWRTRTLSYSSRDLMNNKVISTDIFRVTWTASSLPCFTNVGQAAFQLGGKIFRLRCRMDWFTGFSSEPGVQFVGRSGDEPALPVNRHSLTRPSLNHGDRFT
jgi:hypothetical protein